MPNSGLFSGFNELRVSVNINHRGVALPGSCQRSVDTAAERQDLLLSSSR